jgi:superfamily II DNA/RNA helicase
VSHGFSAIALHGDMDQSARTAALDQFRRGEIKLLVASDVRRAGSTYRPLAMCSTSTSRIIRMTTCTAIGRTGRAGRSGAALTIGLPTTAKQSPQ